MDAAAIPLSLYVHIPWCVQKCPYCDFNSHQAKSTLDEERYVQQLLNDLAYQADFIQGRELTSIFFGGGTPSLFSDKSIGYFLDQASQKVSFSSDIEITLEANPGTADAKFFLGFEVTSAVARTSSSRSSERFRIQKDDCCGSTAGRCVGDGERSARAGLSCEAPLRGVP